jgi:hypothetical protein
VKIEGSKARGGCWGSKGINEGNGRGGKEASLKMMYSIRPTGTSPGARQHFN